MNARTAGGDTALHLAAANGHADCCELLLGLSADVNAIAGGNTPLHNAVRCDKAAGESIRDTVPNLLLIQYLIYY